jgi:hypothetical protein
MVSTMSVGGLKKCLPIADLKQASHCFELLTYRGRHPRLQSIINLTCAGTPQPLSVLQAHECSLGQYSVVAVELAFDLRVGSVEEAESKLRALVGILGKRCHRRGFIRVVHEPLRTPPAGCVPGPTLYLEDYKSGTGLKSYIRQEKLAAGSFGGLVVRLEWTLKRKPAITRYFGGNQLINLLDADLNIFLERAIRLEQVDHLALGALARGLKIKTQRGSDLDKHYRNRNWRAAHLVLRALAYQEYDLGHFPTSEQALEICQNSPAMIRSHFRKLRGRKRRAKVGRPRKDLPPPKLPITDARIDACFRPIKLTRVTEPV